MPNIFQIGDIVHITKPKGPSNWGALEDPWDGKDATIAAMWPSRTLQGIVSLCYTILEAHPASSAPFPAFEHDWLTPATITISSGAIASGTPDPDDEDTEKLPTMTHNDALMGLEQGYKVFLARKPSKPDFFACPWKDAYSKLMGDLCTVRAVFPYTWNRLKNPNHPGDMTYISERGEIIITEEYEETVRFNTAWLGKGSDHPTYRAEMDSWEYLGFCGRCNKLHFHERRCPLRLLKAGGKK